MATIRRKTLGTGAALAVAPAAMALLPSIQTQLQDWIVGQEAAVSAVAAAIGRYRAGTAESGRPLASFHFLGPNGVGKTHLAKAMAALAFGTTDALRRVDMSGVADPSPLIEAAQASPRHVLLLDQVDKVSDDALVWLRQLLREARVTDGQGRSADFTRAFVILTSLKPATRLGEVTTLARPVSFLPLTPAQKAEVARRMAQRST
ncbi:MAG TPA: AAA family ATPase [Chloroflexota bacterium]|nr:AAA family ATPase [Chloroflexota bacterium]